MVWVMRLTLLKLFYKGGSSIATITVLEQSPDHILLFQCNILCHVYNTFMYNLCYFATVLMDLLYYV